MLNLGLEKDTRQHMLSTTQLILSKVHLKIKKHVLGMDGFSGGFGGGGVQTPPPPPPPPGSGKHPPRKC